MRDFEVTNDDASGRFYAVVDGYTAELTYRLTGDRMVITHTGVPPAIEGRGIGSALVRAAVEDATARDLTIVPLCPFVGAWLGPPPGKRGQGGSPRPVALCVSWGGA